MPRFFVRQNSIDLDNNNIIICGNDAFHIARSLRMAVGQSIIICDMQMNEYTCRLQTITDDAVTASIVSVKHIENEPPFTVFLFQALPKGDKLDTVIQKSVECGVGEIIPFDSERCVVKVKQETEQRKTDRRCRIAAEAAKQCGRGIIPIVRDTVSFEQMLQEASKCDLKLLCYEGEESVTLKTALTSAKDIFNSDKTNGKMTKIAIVIGSEGGFSQKEVEKARQNGLVTVGLGKRILRTESAAMFVLSCIVYVTEL